MLFMQIFFAVIISVWLVNGLAGGLLFLFDIACHCRHKGIQPPLFAYLAAFGTGLFHSLTPIYGLKFVWEGVRTISTPNRFEDMEAEEN